MNYFSSCKCLILLKTSRNYNEFCCWHAILRLHYLEFPPGTLDKQYEKLLQCDPNLLKLSQRPFPSLSSPYFHTDCYKGSKEFSLDFYRHGQLPLPFSSMHSPFKSIQQIQAIWTSPPTIPSYDKFNFTNIRYCTVHIPIPYCSKASIVL